MTLGPVPHTARATLPDDTRVGAVSLQVSHLDRSLQFYEEVVGLHALAREDGPGARSAVLGAPGARHPLLRLREKPGARPFPPRGRLGLYHFAVLLPTRGDLGRFIRNAVARRAQVGAADHWFSEATYLVDPDGLTVEVYRDRPRQEWRYAGGELGAGMDPLDFGGMDAAAGDAPWTGVPEGTVIGHMHFYVGQLDAAESFYVDGLGFAPVIRSFPGALFVSAGGYHHHVGLNTWRAGAPVATDDDARLTEWELVLPGEQAIDAAAERLRAKGFQVRESPEGLIARDPWDIAVRLTTASANTP